MTEQGHFTVQSQNGLFRVVENITEYGGISSMPTEYNIVNGIPTKAEAEFLCNILNSLHKENKELKKIVKQLHIDNTVLNKRYDALIDDIEKNKRFKFGKFRQKMCDLLWECGCDNISLNNETNEKQIFNNAHYICNKLLEEYYILEK